MFFCFIEYLYPLLVQEGLLKDQDVLYGYFANIVMYTENRHSGINLDFSYVPAQTGFCLTGGKSEISYTIPLTENLTSLKPTKEQIDHICYVLDKLTDLNPQQHKAKVAEKVLQDSSMENSWKYRALFSVVVGEIQGDPTSVMIARSNGDHIWYDMRGEHFFWAVPEFKPNNQTQPIAGEEGYKKALELANKMTGQST